VAQQYQQQYKPAAAPSVPQAQPQPRTVLTAPLPEAAPFHPFKILPVKPPPPPPGTLGGVPRIGYPTAPSTGTVSRLPAQPIVQPPPLTASRLAFQARQPLAV
jgi:hypothetical protein